MSSAIGSVSTAVGLIDLTARYPLGHGLDTVVEGILRDEVCGTQISLADGVARVLADCGWETAGHGG